MLFFKRGESESLDDFFQRTNGSIKRILRESGIRAWDETAHVEVHRWAGVLARLNFYDPARLTSRVFLYRDWNWIHSIAQRNRGRQLHGRILRTWRWERPLYAFYGTNWQSKALENEAWADDANRFLEFRLLHR